MVGCNWSCKDLKKNILADCIDVRFMRQQCLDKCMEIPDSLRKRGVENKKSQRWLKFQYIFQSFWPPSHWPAPYHSCSLSCHNKGVVFICIPGNAVVDWLPVSWSVAVTSVIWLQSLWQFHWDTVGKNKLHAILPCLSDHPPSMCYVQWEDVEVSRLLDCGITYSKHSHLLWGKPPPVCPWC